MKRNPLSIHNNDYFGRPFGRPVFYFEKTDAERFCKPALYVIIVRGVTIWDSILF